MLLLPPKIGFPRNGRMSYRHPTLPPPEARPQKRSGNGSWWERRRKKNKEKKKKEVPVPSAQEPKTKGKLPRRSPAARSGDAIRVSARDGESVADILKAIKTPKMQERRSSPFGESGGRRSSWSPKRGVTSRASKRRSTRRSGRRSKLNLWSRRGPLKLGTSTKQSQEKRLLPRCASRSASQTSGTSAGCTNALAVCRLRWSV